MEKMDHKLTDRELIEAVLAWYAHNQSTEQLREAVSAYVQQNAGEAPAAARKFASLESGTDTFQQVPTYQNDSKNLADKEVEEFAGVPYQPFEPVDEDYRGGGWGVDVWALYYGMEDFLHRISLGLLTMQRLAVAFCIFISIVVAIGAWQSSLSNERQKKATFKSMVGDRAAMHQEPSSQPEPSPSLASESLASESLASESLASESLASASLASGPTDAGSAPTMVKSNGFSPVGIEFSTALSLMEKAAWDDALANLQMLENDGRQELQPMLSLLQVEALIQKRDTESMELARQLLMDCKSGEFEVVYSLLVARWMLIGSAVDRNRFLSEVASLPASTRERMATWAHVRNGSKDAMAEAALAGYASSGKSDMCDLLFLATFHYSIGKSDETVRELLDMQQKLRKLQTSGTNKVEDWLLETAKLHLASKVDEILALAHRKLSRQIN